MIKNPEKENQIYKLKSMISMSKAAQRLVVGSRAVVFEVERGRAKILITTKDASDNTKKEMKYLASLNKISYIDAPFFMDDMKKEIGKKVAILCVTDIGLAKAIVDIHNKIIIL